MSIRVVDTLHSFIKSSLKPQTMEKIHLWNKIDFFLIGANQLSHKWSLSILRVLAEWGDHGGFSGVTVGLPCDIKGVPTNDQKKLRGWCKYEVSWGSMCRNLGMCFTEIIMLSLHIFFIEVWQQKNYSCKCPRVDVLTQVLTFEWTFFNKYMDLVNIEEYHYTKNLPRIDVSSQGTTVNWMYIDIVITSVKI